MRPNVTQGKKNASGQENQAAAQNFMDRMGDRPSLVFEWLSPSRAKAMDVQLAHAHDRLKILNRGTAFLYVPRDDDARPLTDEGAVPKDADAQESYVFDRCVRYSHFSHGVRKLHRKAWDKVLHDSSVTLSEAEVEEWRSRYRAYAKWLLTILETHMVEHLPEDLHSLARSTAARDLWSETLFGAYGDWEQNLVEAVYVELLLRCKNKSGSAAKRKSRPKRDVVEPTILHHLMRYPHDTVQNVADIVGCSTGLVSQSPTWKLNQRRLKIAKMHACDPKAIPLVEKAINEAGGRPGQQFIDHKRQEESLDDDIDRREMTSRIGAYVKEHPNATREEIANACGCTAGDVERRDAELKRLVEEQVEDHRTEIVVEDPTTKSGKTQKWVQKRA